MSTAIQTQQSGPMATIKTLLESRKDALAQLIPKHLSADRLLKVALNCIAKTPKLQECTPGSLLQCIITSAELGLDPGGALGGAYLVPFKPKEGPPLATLIIGYRGFIDLMRRSGQLASIRAVVVHQRDTFKLTEGIEQTILHEPFLDGDPGPLRFVYVVAKLKDGSVQVEFMTRDAIESVKKRSRSAGYGPWVTDYEEMAKKTVVRRAAKYLPMSPELEKAEETDNADYVDGEVSSEEFRAQLAAGSAVADDVLTAPSATQAVKEKVRKLRVQDTPKPSPPPVAAAPTEPPPPGDADAPWMAEEVPT